MYGMVSAYHSKSSEMLKWKLGVAWKGGKTLHNCCNRQAGCDGPRVWSLLSKLPPVAYPHWQIFSFLSIYWSRERIIANHISVSSAFWKCLYWNRAPYPKPVNAETYKIIYGRIWKVLYCHLIINPLFKNEIYTQYHCTAVNAHFVAISRSVERSHDLHF